MTKKPKKLKPLNSRIDEKVWNDLDEYCWEHRQMKGTIVETALKEYLAKYKKAAPAPAQAQAAPQVAQAPQPVPASDGQLVRQETAPKPRPSAPPAGVPPHVVQWLRECRREGLAPTIEHAVAIGLRDKKKALRIAFDAGEIDEPEFEAQMDAARAWARDTMPELEAQFGTGPLL